MPGAAALIASLELTINGVVFLGLLSTIALAHTALCSNNILILGAFSSQATILPIQGYYMTSTHLFFCLSTPLRFSPQLCV